ncbi:MAG TPA: RNA polymerase sigma factor [Cyclobacteriaceae bacterium]|nr:RNA polymerase sigma factor [Cyclobacteriaceae bacterium]
MMDLKDFENRILPSKQKLYRFACRLLGSDEEAKDLVQEVFIKVWDRRHEMDEVVNTEAWCMRVIRNMAYDKLRQKQRRPSNPLDATFDLEIETPDPHKHMELSDNIKRVGQLIAALPEKQKTAIHLRDVEGYSYNEISDIMGIDLNQVKTNLFRARNVIKEKLISINAYGL